MLNLSRPDEWVETFGMTVLEAMHCGRPVIVPTIGGPCELVEDGQEGFHINSKNIDMLVSCINSISSDFSFYKRLSQAAELRAMNFETALFTQSVQQLFAAGHVHQIDRETENISVPRKSQIA